MEASALGNTVVENHASGGSAAGVFAAYCLRWATTPSLSSGLLALASAIGLADSPARAHRFSSYATYWEPYSTISLVYWVITFLLAQLVKPSGKEVWQSDSHS